MTQRDVAVIFLSGHGKKESASGYDFLPYDADQDNPELTYLHAENRSLIGSMSITSTTYSIRVRLLTHI